MLNFSKRHWTEWQGSTLDKSREDVIFWEVVTVNVRQRMFDSVRLSYKEMSDIEYFSDLLSAISARFNSSSSSDSNSNDSNSND